MSYLPTCPPRNRAPLDRDRLAAVVDVRARPPPPARPRAGARPGRLRLRAGQPAGDQGDHRQPGLRPVAGRARGAARRAARGGRGGELVAVVHPRQARRGHRLRRPREHAPPVPARPRGAAPAATHRRAGHPGHLRLRPPARSRLQQHHRPAQRGRDARGDDRAHGGARRAPGPGDRARDRRRGRPVRHAHARHRPRPGAVPGRPGVPRRVLESSLRAIRTVKAAGAEDRQLDLLLARAAESRDQSVVAVRREALVWTVSWAGVQAAIVVVLGFGRGASRTAR